MLCIDRWIDTIFDSDKHSDTTTQHNTENIVKYSSHIFFWTFLKNLLYIYIYIYIYIFDFLFVIYSIIEEFTIYINFNL